MIGGKPNVSACGDSNNDVVIYLKLINPQQHNTLAVQNPGDLFSLSSRGQIKSLIQKDFNTIEIIAALNYADEGKTITLSGCLWPDNRTGYADIEELKRANPELCYSTTFIQNTPPDQVTDLDNQEESHSYFQQTEKHFVSFTIPDQNKNWNKDAAYEICCYSKTNNRLIAKIEKPLSELSSYVKGTTFSYVFDEQEDNLYYNYTVQVKGKNGLKSSIVSTNSALGEKILKPPVIVFTSNGNPITPNSQKDNDGFEYLEVESLNDTVVVTITSEDGTKITGEINNNSIQNAKNSYSTDLQPNNNNLEITIKQDGCQNVKVIRKIKVVQQLQEPSFEFYKEETFTNIIEKSTDYEEVSGYSDYDYYNIRLIETEKLYFNYTKRNDADTLYKPNKEYTKKFLQLGYHILNIKVQRQYYQPRTFTKYIYVQGVLNDATLSVVQVSQNGATETVENNIPLWTYSYLKTDDVTFEVTPGNNGNTISEVKVNNTTLTKNNSNLYETDAFTEDKTIVIKQTKPHCKSRITTKTVKVKIKPIKASILEATFFVSIKDVFKPKISGDLYLYLKNTDPIKIKEFNNYEYEQLLPGWPFFTPDQSQSYILTSPYSVLIISSNNLKETTKNKNLPEFENHYQLSDFISYIRSNNLIKTLDPKPLASDGSFINFGIIIGFEE